jgi:hypothetical protein
MEWTAAVRDGLIWSVLWSLPITLIEIAWPQIFLHDYPRELQEVITLPPLNGKRKIAAYTFTFCWIFLVIAFLFWSELSSYCSAPTSFGVLFLHAYVMAFIWNFLDLVIMDWGIFCTWQPAFIVLPGSERHPAYRDYHFHFIGFLKGCIISAIGASICAGISFVILSYFIW